MDTGSSDLWIIPTNETMHILNDTHIPTNVSYGTGSVSGTIEFAELRFGEYVVPSQGKHDNGNQAMLTLSYIRSAFIFVDQVCMSIHCGRYD